MSKKIIFTPEQIDTIIKLYVEELKGTPAIGELFNVHKAVINRTLKENGIVLDQSGRRNIGGKSEANKRYQAKNKDDIKIYHQEWSKENRDDLRKYHSTWRDNNRVKVRKWARDYERRKRSEDPKYRLSARTRTAVWQLLKERGVKKTNKTFELLDYTIEELMGHLEGLFTEGMNWDNYGEWHVDHKKPMTSFNFTSTDDAEFKECWSLNNLQPLWGPDNLSKGPRYL